MKALLFLLLVGGFYTLKFQPPTRRAEPGDMIEPKVGTAPQTKSVETHEGKVELPKQRVIWSPGVRSKRETALRTLTKIPLKKKDSLPPEISFDEPVSEEAISQQAINVLSPLEEIAFEAFSEPTLSESTHETAAMAAVQLDPVLVLRGALVLEPRLTGVAGSLVRSDFSDIRYELQRIQSQEGSFQSAFHAPEEQALQAVRESSSGAEVAAVAALKQNDSQASNDDVPFIVKSARENLVIEQQNVEESPREPDALAPEDSGPDETNALDGISWSLEREKLNRNTSALATGPLVASLSKHVGLNNQTKIPPMNTHVELPPTGVEKSTDEAPSDDAGVDSGVVHGRLAFDEPMRQWLEAHVGHVELRFIPGDRTDVSDQDGLFIDYEFPEEDFDFDMRGMRGKYRLVADIYEANTIMPLARLAYPKSFGPYDYKERVRFTIRKAAFDKLYRDQRVGPLAYVSLLLTVFEGASGNHHQPSVVSNARVRVAGYPDLGEFESDRDGNVKIPRVPVHSQLLIEVSADGYFDTQRIIPVFRKHAYVPMYLISKDKVQTITHYFTRKEQSDQRSVLVGRVFDPTTRVPQPNVRVSLSSRRGPPVYIDSLPDLSLKETARTGLFAFFNITPSFRVLRRDGLDKRSLLLNLRPDSGYYVETGRGGMGKLRGKVVDPFQGAVGPAKIRIVGDPNSEVEARSDGAFEITGLDHPPGMVTLEVEADGYRTTWQSISWNLREREERHPIYLLEADLIEESAKMVAKIRVQKGRGILIGGAEQGVLSKQPRCVSVELEKSDGISVAEEHGPYPLIRPKPIKGELCLTRDQPGFAYFNLEAGEYVLKWLTAKGKIFRSHVVHVGIDRVSMVVN